MARTYLTGFELNTLTAGVEFTLTGTGQTITTGSKRTGTNGLRISGMTSATPAGIVAKWVAATTNGPYWHRTYLNIQTLPSAENRIMTFNGATGTMNANTRCYITLDQTGVLRLYTASGPAQIGSASSALSTNTWYRIEWHYDNTGGAGAGKLDAQIDGVSFASSTTTTFPGAVFAFNVGGNLNSEAQTTGEWWFDDIAVNDSTGSAQTAFPGAGSIVITRPTGAGDSTQWTIAGSVPAATNWQSVNEVPPDDAVTLVNEALINDVDLYTVASLGLHSYDTITLVAVGGRFNNDVADATSAFKFELEKTGSGTKQQSASIVPNSTTWHTNTITGATFGYPLVAYTDPDGAAWTNTTLDSMQIGMISGTVGVHKVQVTNIFAYVDYVPGSPPPAGNSGSTLSMMGVG